MPQTHVNNPITNDQFVLDAYRAAGVPMATVYLPTPSASQNADQEFDIRRKNAVALVRDQAPDRPQLAARVEEALAGFRHQEGASFVAVVTESDVVFKRTQVRPLTSTAVHVGLVPALLPLLAAQQHDIEHLAVLIDRSGADVMNRAGVGDPIDVTEVVGEELHLHRSHPGGWSQRRFQQIAENAWESNAKEVVDSIIDEFPTTDLVVVGGDVRAVGFFTDHLPARLSPPIQVDGSRQAGADAFLDRADVALRTVAAERLTDQFNRLRSALSAGHATNNSGEVLTLLAQGRIDTLFVANDFSEPDRAMGSVGLGSGEVTVPRNDGAVALAAKTAAQVIVTPRYVADMGDGIAGITRG
ncbi:MAG: Vms1/Ankzf1 family peptidyl-tRNA hydrolase [Acidimicrobiales bacterium]